MPVVPYRSDLFQHCEEIQDFLVDCQERAIRDRRIKIASFSLAVEPLDPIALLPWLAKVLAIHFYYEYPTQQRAVVAWGSAVEHQGAGAHRFQQVRQFIKSQLRDIVRHRSSQWQPLEPRFFCRFTFFEQSAGAFPAASVFLPRFQLTQQQARFSLGFNLPITPQGNLDAILLEIQSCLRRLETCRTLLSATPQPLVPTAAACSAIEQSLQPLGSKHYLTAFRNSVTQVLTQIQQQRMRKVVLAQTLDVQTPAKFWLPASLANLRQCYPDCYIFSTSNGQGQTFLGASPERLISITRQQLFTDALAGSAPRGQTARQDTAIAQRLRHSRKERYEHQVVVDFIAQRLRQLGLQPHHSSVPSLLKLSNIQHLHTPIQAQLSAEHHPLKILEVLHPTPAVAGFPSEVACRLIQQHESFERSLYAAPLGWVDANGDSEFIVGIRSALINQNQARLYAGAGIVAGSNPDKEVAEIQLKLQALLKALAVE
ncbi:isochorismate synthase [Almyronema epifaneia]|uniref:isochorismate synthase n=1 Tax=Almyronema epifaneia S1 TaxID=2991925 RepID=A0ABW6IHX8_9CYAN